LIEEVEVLKGNTRALPGFTQNKEGLCCTCAGPDKLIRRRSIDARDLASPPRQHVVGLTLAAERRINIYCSGAWTLESKSCLKDVFDEV
jgi:hypothetical protein